MEDLSKVQGTLITFKEFPGKEYILVPPSGNKTMEIFTKLTGILAPALGAGIQSGIPFMRDTEVYVGGLSNEDSDYVEKPELDIFPIATLLGDAINSEDCRKIAKDLLDGLYQTNGSGTPIAKVDLDRDLGGRDFVIQLKLLEFAINESIKIPLVLWLESKGLSGIGLALQSAISAALPSIETT